MNNEHGSGQDGSDFVAREINPEDLGGVTETAPVAPEAMSERELLDSIRDRLRTARQRSRAAIVLAVGSVATASAGLELAAEDSPMWTRVIMGASAGVQILVAGMSARSAHTNRQEAEQMGEPKRDGPEAQA